MAELRWVYRYDHDTGDPQWTSANYNSVEEALLQGAHDHLFDATVGREVYVDGELVHDGKSIAAAAKKLAKARESNGFGAHGDREDFDSAAELKVVA